MRRIALPPSRTSTSDMSAPVASAAARLQDAYIFAHENALKCIDNLARAYPILVGVTPPLDASPEATTPQPPHVPPPSNASGSPSASLAHVARAVAAAMKRRDENFMRQVFNRHADSNGKLSERAVVVALKEVQAPIMLQGETFRRADVNLTGLVDFAECELASLRITVFASL
jgi:hypothetical protein